MFDSIKKLFGIPTKAELHEALSTDLNCIFTEDEGPHWKAITQKWWGIDERKAQLLRECQIFISSLRHGANSEKPKTSHQNAANAKAIWFHGLRGEICLRDQLASVLQPEQFNPFEKEVENSLNSLAWRLPYNEAKALIAKVEKLKTPKGRRPKAMEAFGLMYQAAENGCPTDRISAMQSQLIELGFESFAKAQAIAFKSIPSPP